MRHSRRCAYGAGAGLVLLLLTGTAMADWNPGDSHKMHFPQLPDLTPMGIDVACDTSVQSLWVADDFLCTESGVITGIHIWASSLHDNPFLPMPLFQLALWSDRPAIPGGNFSQPLNILTNYVLTPDRYTVRAYTNLLAPGEFWWDPSEGPPIPDADHFIWQYNFTFPESEGFLQTSGTVYWLSVNALLPPNFRFGWKTSFMHWNDDATWSRAAQPPWLELISPITGLSLDMAFVIDGKPFPPPPPPAEVKWIRPPDVPAGCDVPSYASESTNVLIADDFVSDGRPIVGLRWWGSYLGYGAADPDVRAPPAGARPWAFDIRWFGDVPAVGAVPSRPGQLIKGGAFPLSTFGSTDAAVVERYFTSVWHAAESVWEHEFEYELIFTNSADVWNEKYGVVYWVSVQADFGAAGIIPQFPWGWMTSSPKHHFNDDASRLFPPGAWDDLHFQDVPLQTPYGTDSVEMAFALLTDVKGRRGAKWRQPPDMELGVDMESFAGAGQDLVRADDFISDGRRITDIHWWGSYIEYMTNKVSGAPPPMPPALPTDERPLGFRLSWHTDQPAPPEAKQGYSMPADVLTNIFVPISQCHEVYYGTVTQFWKSAQYFEHEFQYYVDLMSSNFVGAGPWLETRGVIYWLNIQAVFPPGWEAHSHKGWGWKTTSPAHHWNDYAVESRDGRSWLLSIYPIDHPLGQPPPAALDLAFELTTDEAGPSPWHMTPVITNLVNASSNVFVVSSVGDLGAGVQVLQRRTNMLAGVWEDAMTNALPLPPPFINVWPRSARNRTNEFYRVLQR